MICSLFVHLFFFGQRFHLYWWFALLLDSTLCQLHMGSFPKLHILFLSNCFPEVPIAFLEMEGLIGFKCKRTDAVDWGRKPIYAGLLMTRIKPSQFEHSLAWIKPSQFEHLAPSLRTIHNSDINFFPSPQKMDLHSQWCLDC